MSTTEGTDRSSAYEVEIPAGLREAAKEVSNWGKWGPEDELGTLNYITPDVIKRAATLVRSGTAFSLSIPFDAYGPQGAHGFRRNPIHLMTLDGGDKEMAERLGGWGGETEAQVSHIWRGPMRFNDDFIIMPLQAATQWDALSHVYYEQKLYNGFGAETVTSLGAARDSIDKVAVNGVVSRGILLDVARHQGVRHLAPGTVILPEDLDRTAEAQGVEVSEGDIVLVRTGWWPQFRELRDGDKWAMNSPGLSWQCGRWLSSHQVAAVACDNIAVETSTVELEGVMLPLHMLTLRDMGMMLGEMWNLEELSAACAEDGKYEFLLVSQPLMVTGAVGSPINPLAVK